MHFIPNGIDTERYTINDSMKKTDDTILYSGRLKIRKGVDKLLEAARELKEYNFWLTGKGHLEEKIEGENVELLGFVDDLPDQINKATICVFPSIWENWPLVGLEAMACGKPVIGTPRGFSEYITSGHDGIIIPDNDPGTIKNAIINLMNDQELRDKISKNARMTAEKYDWKNIVKQYKHLYEDLMKRKGN